MNPKTISKIDFNIKENRKELISKSFEICKEINKDKKKKSIPKLFQMESSYKFLCEKLNAGIIYTFTNSYIGTSLFDKSTVYTVVIKIGNNSMTYRCNCLMELYSKTICILYSIYLHKLKRK